MTNFSNLNKLNESGNFSSSLAVNIEKSEENKSKGSEIALKKPILSESSESLDSEQRRNNLIAEVKENLEKLNEYIPVTATNLVFEFDELGEPPIIKVYDKESNEVIREIPTKEFREVAKALEEFADKLTNKGLLFNKTA